MMFGQGAGGDLRYVDDVRGAGGDLRYVDDIIIYNDARKVEPQKFHHM